MIFFNMKKLGACVLAASLLAPAAFAATVIKFACLAPRGTAWMNSMEEYAAAVKTETKGEVVFKIYAGGVQGDEKDVIRKIRLGQLQAGAFTGVGLGEIAPAVRVMDSPYLFKNYGEVDFVLSRFDDRFSKMFEEKGYILLGWTEVGFVYIYTNTPVTKISDLGAVKMWTWEGDPTAEAALKALGVSPIPLSITDVMSSLQTGLINGVYTTPLAALALQWFTKTKYMFDFSIADSNGAVLISKAQYDKLTSAQRQTLLALGKTYFRKLTETARTDNDKSIATLKGKGMKITAPASAAAQAELDAAGEKARAALVGRLYPAQLLKEVEAALSEYRGNQAAGSGGAKGGARKAEKSGTGKTEPKK
ncbi:MAG: TRAP transporter substrate-binding protein DctP [Elusimicrobiaceae bacterium]|nr:TRAP transporter substrate-binding protein DctP [Elusimicrobiaceae bacterium]